MEVRSRIHSELRAAVASAALPGHFTRSPRRRRESPGSHEVTRANVHTLGRDKMKFADAARKRLERARRRLRAILKIESPQDEP
jgi:hypothetical protein